MGLLSRRGAGSDAVPASGRPAGGHEGWLWRGGRSERRRRRDRHHNRLRCCRRRWADRRDRGGGGCRGRCGRRHRGRGDDGEGPGGDLQRTIAPELRAIGADGKPAELGDLETGLLGEDQRERRLRHIVRHEGEIEAIHPRPGTGVVDERENLLPDDERAGDIFGGDRIEVTPGDGAEAEDPDDRRGDRSRRRHRRRRGCRGHRPGDGRQWRRCGERGGGRCRIDRRGGGRRGRCSRHQERRAQRRRRRRRDRRDRADWGGRLQARTLLSRPEHDDPPAEQGEPGEQEGQGPLPDGVRRGDSRGGRRRPRRLRRGRRSRRHRGRTVRRLLGSDRGWGCRPAGGHAADRRPQPALGRLDRADHRVHRRIAVVGLGHRHALDDRHQDRGEAREELIAVARAGPPERAADEHREEHQPQVVLIGGGGGSRGCARAPGSCSAASSSARGAWRRARATRR